MSAQDKATKFEAGKTYFARSIGDYDSIAKIKVVKVTAKMVTFVYLGETIRRKFDQRENHQRLQVNAAYSAYSKNVIEEEAVEPQSSLVETEVIEQEKELERLNKIKDDASQKALELSEKKRRLFGNVDIASPISKEEKELDRELQAQWSIVNQAIMAKRKIKKAMEMKIQNAIATKTDSCEEVVKKQEDDPKTLTAENAHTAYTVEDKAHPEYGFKRFNYQDQPMNDGEKPLSSIGTGSNSKVIFESEYHLYRIVHTRAEVGLKGNQASETEAAEVNFSTGKVAEESAPDYRDKEILITMHCPVKGHKVARIVSMGMFSIPDYGADDGWECNIITENEGKRVDLIKQWIIERANDQHESILEFVRYEIVEEGVFAERDLNRQFKLEAEKQGCESAADVVTEAMLDIQEAEEAEAKSVDSSEPEAKKLAIAAEIIGWKAFKDGKKCVPALDRNLDSLLENLPAGTGLAIMIYKRWERGWTNANLAAPVVCEEETSEAEAAQMESEGPEEAKTSLTIESAMTIDSVDEGLLEANGVWGGEFRGQWKYKILHKNEKFFRSSDRGLALGHAISAYNSIPVADRVGTKEEAYNKINKARYDRLDAIWGLSSMDELSGMMQDCKELSSSLFNSALNGMDARPFSVAMNRSVRNRLSVGYVGETIADLAFYMEERAKIEAMAE